MSDPAVLQPPPTALTGQLGLTGAELYPASVENILIFPQKYFTNIPVVQHPQPGLQPRLGYLPEREHSVMNINQTVPLEVRGVADATSAL